MRAGYSTDEQRAAFVGSSLQGVTRWMREESGEDHLCCDGPHVFCYTFDEDGDRTVTDWVHQVLRLAPEGSRLRFSVEVVHDA